MTAVLATLLLNIPGDVQHQRQIIDGVQQDLEESGAGELLTPNIHQIKDIAIICITNSFLFPMTEMLITPEENPKSRMLSNEEHDHFFRHLSDEDEGTNGSSLDEHEGKLKEKQEYDTFEKLGFCPTEVYRLVAGVCKKTQNFALKNGFNIFFVNYAVDNYIYCGYHVHIRSPAVMLWMLLRKVLHS